MKQGAKEVDWEVLPPEDKQRRAQVEPLFRWVAVLMDNLLRLPGTRFRFGLNPVIDLIPGVGDLSAAFVSTSVLLYGLRHGLPKALLARMGINVLLNETVGAIPLVGSAFAFWFRCNQRNYELLRGHAGAPSTRRRWDSLFVFAMIALIIAVIIGGMVVSLLVVEHLLRLLTTR
ncbi:MAG TPA: DUF4112 domain-containing protein [Chthoniobacterales bacterium]